MRNISVCVIDDDDIFQFTVTKIFKLLHLTEDVQVFSDGEQALEFLSRSINDESNIPDIIFLDINMPVMDGWQFLEEYAKLKIRLKKQVCIYLVTSSVDQNDINQAKNIKEISDYVIKPLTFEKVRGLVSQFQNIPIAS